MLYSDLLYSLAICLDSVCPKIAPNSPAHLHSGSMSILKLDYQLRIFIKMLFLLKCLYLKTHIKILSHFMKNPFLNIIKIDNKSIIKKIISQIKLQNCK